MNSAMSTVFDISIQKLRALHAAVMTLTAESPSRIFGQMPFGKRPVQHLLIGSSGQRITFSLIPHCLEVVGRVAVVVGKPKTCRRAAQKYHHPGEVAIHNNVIKHGRIRLL